MDEKDKKVKLSEIEEIVKKAMAENKGADAATIKAIVDESVTRLAPKSSVVTDPLEDPNDGFKGFADFAHSVYRANSEQKSLPGGYIDPRLKKIEAKSREKLEKGDVSWVINKTVGTPAVHSTEAEYGAYLIPSGFLPKLLQLTIEKSNILALSTNIPIPNVSVSIPYNQDFDHSSGQLFGGIYYSWMTEEGQFSGTRPKFGQIELRLKKLGGFAYISSEMLTDSAISMEPLLTKQFTDGLAWTLDEAFLNGSGAGQPLGIYNAPCLLQVAKESQQAGDTINVTNLAKMYAQAYDPFERGVWFANRDVLPQLIGLTMTGGTASTPVYLPAGGVSGKPYNTLFGRPIFFSEHCRALGDMGDIYYAVWDEYLVGQKAGDTGLKFDTSIHLKFDFDQVAFRFILRIDGQPWWKTTFTPLYGNVKSPFVSLAVRT